MTNLKMMCVACSVAACAPGYHSSTCTRGSTSDAKCLPCRNGPSVGPFSWTSAWCEFQCNDGYWFNGTACVACSRELACPWEMVNCTATRDSYCLTNHSYAPPPPVMLDHTQFASIFGIMSLGIFAGVTMWFTSPVVVAAPGMVMPAISTPITSVV